MIYDKKGRCYGDGQWHCPFSREWVAKMARVAKVCKHLSDGYIESFEDRNEDFVSYRLDPWNWLNWPQMANGLPPWMQNDG